MITPEEKLEYILNFDENKLFCTKLDDECVNKSNRYRRSI